MNKPHWMSLADYTRYMEGISWSPVCIEPSCGATEDLTFDHRVPRREGGTDAQDNLVIRCRHHNSSKGSKPDASLFGSHFYWDPDPSDPIDRDCLRTFQRQLYEKIIGRYSDFFAQCRFNIARKLYLSFGGVGCGKTLAAACVAWAYNHNMILVHGKGAPRAQTILFVTKEQALRDNIHVELAGDPKDSKKQSDIVANKIRKYPPKVLVAESGSQIRNTALVRQYDIVIACVHQLWDKVDNTDAQIAAILDQFELIFIDEPHFATDQVRGIYHNATQSLVFGLTGSPIDSVGKIIQDFILLHSFGYKESVTHDNCLRHIDPETCFEEIGIGSADVTCGTLSETVETTKTRKYRDAAFLSKIYPDRSVAMSCIQHIATLQKLIDSAGPFELAPHRSPKKFIPSRKFSPHCILKVDGIPAGRLLLHKLKDFFEKNRDDYPIEEGWDVDFVFSASEATGLRVKGNPLTEQHPWFIYHKEGQKFRDETNKKRVYFQRFLIVDGMGREGINNWACCLTGLCCHTDSVVLAVQLLIGRALRSPPLYDKESGMFLVPPKQGDTLHVISHQVYDNRSTVNRAVNFVLDPDPYLQPLITIENLIESLAAPLKTSDPSPDIDTIPDPLPFPSVSEVLTDRERLMALDILGRMKKDGEIVNLDTVVREVLPGGDTKHAPEKLRKLREWTSQAVQDPQSIRDRIADDHPLTPISVVDRELPSKNPSDEYIRQWTIANHPELATILPRLDDKDIKTLLLHLINAHLQTFGQGTFQAITNLEEIRRLYVQEIAYAMKDCMDVKEHDQVIRAMVGSAVKLILNVPETTSASIGSQWDKPPFHVALRDTGVRQRIYRYVRGRLMSKGFVPNVPTALGIEVKNDA